MKQQRMIEILFSNRLDRKICCCCSFIFFLTLLVLFQPLKPIRLIALRGTNVRNLVPNVRNMILYCAEFDTNTALTVRDLVPKCAEYDTRKKLNVRNLVPCVRYYNSRT